MPRDGIRLEGKDFCCAGCKTVYSILRENDLCRYYTLQEHPGVNRTGKKSGETYAALDIPAVRQKLVVFEEGDEVHVTFSIPNMHCSSCIWLLEHLHSVHPGILHSRVSFPDKSLQLVLSANAITLREAAELLDSLGYEPQLSFRDLEAKETRKTQNGRIVRIGIAGFAFANIMLFSLPDYFSGGAMDDITLQHLFRVLSLLLSLPVIFYCANEFFISAWKGIANRFLNIDVPIALAILLTFGRSLYAVISGNGPGYFDTLSGVVFFMLLGRYFQDITYRNINFERDYRAYFPLSVTLLCTGEEKQIPLSELKPGNRIRVRNGELIPADSVLIEGAAHIDYSFVTGESEPVDKSPGSPLYAGGRQEGTAIDMEVVREVSNGYLTSLWNNNAYKDKDGTRNTPVQQLARYFAWIVIGISVFACTWWMFADPGRALDALVTPLIVACPCALLLASAFTYGNSIRLLGREGIYLKNAPVLDTLTKIDTLVFDKTGTLVDAGAGMLRFGGDALTAGERQMVHALASQSAHPYSRAIASFCGKMVNSTVTHFAEIPGLGIEGTVAGKKLRIGSASFTGCDGQDPGVVFVSIDGHVRGNFHFDGVEGAHLEDLLPALRQKYDLYLLSGDNDRDRSHFAPYFGGHMFFHYGPQDKLDFIRGLQQQNKCVLMAGDGLNDAGALKQSDVGMAVTAGPNAFTPASDIIIPAETIDRLPMLLRFAHFSRHIILISFLLSFLYNVCGLYFAVQGLLSPVIAAVLMPLSTITIVLFTTGSTALYARLHFKKVQEHPVHESLIAG